MSIYVTTHTELRYRLDHHPHHGTITEGQNRIFGLAVGFNLVFVVIEVIYGFAADSLALLADAGHNLGDVLGLLIAWGGAALAARGATERHTYGLGRATIMAALSNAMLLLVMSATGTQPTLIGSVLRMPRPGAVVSTSSADVVLGSKMGRWLLATLRLSAHCLRAWVSWFSVPANRSGTPSPDHLFGTGHPLPLEYGKNETGYESKMMLLLYR